MENFKVAQGVIGRPRKHNIRIIINAIRYIMRGSGECCRWRLLPKNLLKISRGRGKVGIDIRVWYIYAKRLSK